MSRAPVFWITVAVALLLGAQTFDPLAFAAVAPTAYVNSNNQFSVNPPSGWSTDTSGAFGTSVIFYGPTDSNFRINMNIIVESTSLSLSAYVSSVKSQLSQGLTNYQLVSEGSETIGGVDAHYLVNSFTQGVYNIEDKQAILVQNQKAYIITSTALQSNYAIYQPAFDESVQTFQVTSAGFPWLLVILPSVIAAVVAISLVVFVKRRRARAVVPPPPPASIPGTTPENPPPP